MAPTDLARLSRQFRDPRMTSRMTAGLGLALLFGGGLAVSMVMLPRLGVQGFALALVGVFFGSLFLIISFRSLAVPFYMVILAVGGFRWLWSVQAPFLPDLYLDRVFVLWLMLVFMVKFFATGQRPRRPYLLDILLLAHATYLFLRIWAYGFVVFTPWTRSILVPYMMYFFGKNIIHSRKQLETFFTLLLVLGFYYSVTSFAQHFHANSLIFPPSIRTITYASYTGRSVGPFGNPAVFGNTIGMILPIHLYFLATIKSRFLKLVILGNFLVGLIALYFTYTRGTWLAGALGLLTVVLVNRRQYLRIFLPVLVVAPVVAMGFLGLGQDKFMKQRVENEDTIGARLGTAVTALRVWRDNPFLGCGFFRYPIVRDNYIEPVEIPGFETIRFVQFRTNALHDMYLGQLAEDGLFGVGLLAAIFLVIVHLYRKIYRWRREGDHFAVYILPLFVGILVVYLVGGLAINYRFFSIMGSMLFATAGIADAYALHGCWDDEVGSVHHRK